MQNTKNFNQVASDKRWVNLMGAMKTVRQEIQQLAPNPERPNQKGPESVKDDSRAAANDDRDASLGSMVLEAFLGANFASAIGDALHMPDWAQNVDWGNAVDVYDEYRNDREQSRADGAGVKGAYSDMFNFTAKPVIRQSAEDLAWERYLQDLPNRRVLEQNLGAMSRAMDRVEKDFTKNQKLAFSM